MDEGTRGFAVWEATPEQAANKVEFMLPEVKYSLVPIVDGKEFLKPYMDVKE